MAASIVVKARSTNPITDNAIPNLKTNLSEKFPVTVGRFLADSITVSISTSYQLFRISAPAITNVLPEIVNKNTSQFAKKVPFVK